ncbi:MAG: aldose epimerase family protein [Acidimicrobiales bacterium]
MMRETRISLDWSYRGFRACVLENDVLRVTVIPEIGAKVHEMVFKPADRDLLYHHPRVALRAPVFGVNVDDWWTGGIDDVIPTGHACTFEGEELPYLGEVWSLPWSLVQESGEAIVVSRDGVITPFRIERRMELRSGEPFLRIHHRITNVGIAAISFNWGIHPGLPVGPDTHIQIPGSRGIVHDSWPRDRLGPRGSEYHWPLPAMADPPTRPGGTWDFHYVTDLVEGWAATWDRQWRSGLGITFPSEVLSCVWVWLVDGGWRGLRCAAVEPWTGFPARLDEAVAAGRARTLSPGASLDVETRLIGFEATGPIRGFHDDGRTIT